jgi:(S)-2-hydroxyglutarate dehydrogenase
MQYDCLMIGGGIVGLATAHKLLEAKPDLKILLVEKEDGIAKHQTGNNSGVIHSGLYYKPGSLKATNCIRGYEMLLEFAQKHSIPYDLCGKVVVATNEQQIPLLQNLYDRGIENGLDKITRISRAELKEIEPHCAGVDALKVPYTGIIDYKEVSKKLGELIREAGGEIMLSTKVLGIKPEGKGAIVRTDNGEFSARLIINCAGLYSDKIAALTHPDIQVRIIPFRGEYYMLKPEAQSLVKHLIYPVPDPNFPFLGVHFTRMIEGGIEAGPNAVFAFKREGYTKTSIDLKELWGSLSWPGFRKVATKYWKTGIGEYYRSFNKSAFTRALQELIPEVSEKDLVPAGAGVRAQACDRSGGLIDDFAFLEKDFIIHVLNAPSPAATSSLSIGKTISEMALTRFQ